MQARIFDFADKIDIMALSDMNSSNRIDSVSANGDYFNAMRFLFHFIQFSNLTAELSCCDAGCKPRACYPYRSRQFQRFVGRLLWSPLLFIWKSRLNDNVSVFPRVEPSNELERALARLRRWAGSSLSSFLPYSIPPNDQPQQPRRSIAVCWRLMLYYLLWISLLKLLCILLGI